MRNHRFPKLTAKFHLFVTFLLNHAVKRQKTEHLETWLFPSKNGPGVIKKKWWENNYNLTLGPTNRFERYHPRQRTNSQRTKSTRRKPAFPHWAPFSHSTGIGISHLCLAWIPNRFSFFLSVDTCSVAFTPISLPVWCCPPDGGRKRKGSFLGNPLANVARWAPPLNK